MTQRSSFFTFLTISLPPDSSDKSPSDKPSFKQFAKSLGKGLATGLSATSRNILRGLELTRQRVTGKGLEYYTGHQRAFGAEVYRRQRVQRPLGTTLMLVILYLAFSFWPFPFFPVFNFFTIFWAAFVLYLFLSRNYMWCIIFIIVFPLFNYSLAMDLFSQGQLLSDDLKEKISIKNPLEAFKGLIYKNYGNFNNPDVVEKEPQKGIQILTFATNEVFKESKPVQIDAKVQVDGFYNSETQRYEEQNIAFSCYQEDNKGNKIPNTDGTIYIQDKPSNSIHITPEQAERTTIHYVSCRYPQGMELIYTGTPVTGTLAGVEEGVEVGNRIVTKKRIVMEATTNMLQIAGIKLWTVEDINAPEDITQVVNDPTLDTDGRSKAQCKRGCGGPYFLTLSTGVMPITELKSPIIRVSFLKNANRFGAIAKLNSLRIIFPESLGVTLGIEGEQTICDFDGQNIQMTLKDEALKQMNTQLTNQLSITDATQLPSLPDFQCSYTVGQPLEKLGFHEVTARADYTFVIRKRGLVDLYKEKTLSGGLT